MTESNKRSLTVKTRQLEQIYHIRAYTILQALISRSATPLETIAIIESLIKYKPERPRLYAIKILSETRQKNNAIQSRNESDNYKKDFTTVSDLLGAFKNG